MIIRIAYTHYRQNKILLELILSERYSCDYRQCRRQFCSMCWLYGFLSKQIDKKEHM